MGFEVDGPWDGSSAATPPAVPPVSPSAAGSAVPAKPVDPGSAKATVGATPCVARSGSESLGGTDSTPPSAGDLRKVLRARMVAVLQTHPKLVQATGAKERADANYKQTDAEYRALTLSPTEDPQVVRDYLAALDESYRRHVASLDALDEASFGLSEADYAHQQSRLELSAAVGQASACAELSKDDVYLAAKHMTDWLAQPSKKAASAPQALARDEAALTDEQLALITALRDATLAAALKAAQALKVGPSVVAAVQRVTDTVCPYVKPPVRPTEEEIQRYLRQAETATVNRQRAHRDVLPLLSVRQATLAELDGSKQSVNAAIDAVKAIPGPNRHSDCPPALAAAARVLQILSTATAGFGDRCSTDSLDKVQRSTPTGRELRQIAEVRDLMRQLAVARASRNEARVTLNDAKIGKDRTFEFSGVAAAKTWQECLEWHARMQSEQLSTERINLSRKTKVELLTELVKQLEADEATASTTLYRYVLAIKPDDQRPPCDELRALMNAAAWMCNPEVNGYSRSRQGDFPIY